jgi:hypothetical protein
MNPPMPKSAVKDHHGDTDTHSISARAETRDQLQADIEAFLSQGGQIQEVPRNFRADPPKKPENNYGRGSI